MGKIKMEQEFQKQAQKREIYPSAQAWEVLAKKLEMAQGTAVSKKPKSNSFSLFFSATPKQLWAAACLILLLLTPLVMQWVKKEDALLKPQPVVFEQELEKTKEPLAHPVVAQPGALNTLEYLGKTAAPLVVGDAIEGIIAVKAPNISSLSKAVTPKNASFLSVPTLAGAQETPSHTLVAPKANLALAQANTSIDLEVENLLSHAMKTLQEAPAFSLPDSLQKLAVNPTQAWSGAELLFEVENELNASFRAKVIQELKQNVWKLSQAMAQGDAANQ